MTDKTKPLTFDEVLNEKKDEARRKVLEQFVTVQLLTDTALHNAEAVYAATKAKAEAKSKAIREVVDNIDSLTVDQVKTKLSEVSALPL